MPVFGSDIYISAEFYDECVVKRFRIQICVPIKGESRCFLHWKHNFSLQFLP